MTRATRIAVTAGEPAGIGPELALALASRPVADALPVVLGDFDSLAALAARRQVPIIRYRPDATLPQGALAVLDCPLAVAPEAGRLDVRNGSAMLAMLDRAIDGCMTGEFAAMVTAPLHKGVICDAGHAFSGHTEYLAQRTDTARVVMMLVGGGLRVALATTHLPLSAVPATLTQEMLADTLRILCADLARHFGLSRPRILVAGLNPHAGEGGHLGREEIDVIQPVLAALRAEGHDVVGPMPACTLFVPSVLSGADAVLAMYHDQGLPVLKHASFGQGVNVTLGLPIIRTSVDHGTALDLAGKGRADPGSLFAAFDLAVQMSRSSNGGARPGQP